ncbi:MAG: hypothetical protein WC582_05265 [Patescibacteria group bacterium]
MTADLTVKSVQITDGNEMIPTATLVFITSAGEEKISCASQLEENIHHAIFKAIWQAAELHLTGFREKNASLLSCGGNFSYRGKCNAHAHIYFGTNGSSKKIKRNAWHGNNIQMAIARAILNCFRDIAEA